MLDHFPRDEHLWVGHEKAFVELRLVLRAALVIELIDLANGHARHIPVPIVQREGTADVGDLLAGELL